MITFKGFKTLEKKLKQKGMPLRSLNSIFQKVAAQGERDLKIATTGKKNVRTGNTSRAWLTQKKGLCDYLITNKVQTDDNKHYIARLLDEGRGEIFPVKAKRLYIPLTNKGARKEGKFGVDFVLAKKAKAVKGLDYIKKETKRASRHLTKEIIKEIRK